MEGTEGWASSLAVRELDVEESWMTKTKIRQGVESGICSDEKRTQVKNGGERKHLYQVLSG